MSEHIQKPSLVGTQTNQDDQIDLKQNISGKKLSAILRMLMHECGNLKEADLIKHTNLPQTTINRILHGETNDPRLETLRPLAKFFGITIGQLIGDEPLNSNRTPGTYNPTAIISIPIISWKNATHWNALKEDITPYNHKDWIVAENNFGEGAFALKSLASLEPLFPKNSTLIIAPHAEPFDGSYIILTIKENEAATLRRIIHDGGDIYLKALDNNIPPIQYDEKIHKICGCVTEVRLAFQ